MKVLRLLILVALFVSTPLFASTPKEKGVFSVPESKGLQIKIVSYDGSTNGSMTVDVINTSKKKIAFNANGLFFVPDMDPENAPQRLGAAGPFTAGSDKVLTTLKLAPNQKQRIQLEVFCIDSHRPSPNTETPFRLGQKRLPKQLRKEISETNTKIYQQYKGKPKKARDSIQQNMWQNRDKKWIQIEGERKDEKSSKKVPQNIQQQEQRPRPKIRRPMNY